MWSNLSSHIRPPYISDQTENLKQLKLFPPFVLFRVDVEDKKRMSALNSKEKQLIKAMAIFSKYKYMSIFDGSIWFTYKDPDKFEIMTKQKPFDSRRYTKYDPDNNYHILIPLFFVLYQTFVLKIQYLFFLFEWDSTLT